MTEPDTYLRRAGVTYCTHEGVELQGDLYLPDGEGPFPVLIGAPGGGWRMCARATLRHWGLHLAAHGFGLFAVDYRVASAERKAHPEAARDVIAAVRFVRSSAQDFAIDANRIGLLGVSAGAHLASLAALAHDHSLFKSTENDAFAATPAHVTALVAVSGIYNLLQHWQADLALNPAPGANLARNLIGADPYEDQRAYFEASPLSHLSYSKNAMPVLVAWGASDEYVNPTQSESFVRGLQQARFNVRTHQAPGASHFWFNEPLDPGGHSAMFAPGLVRFLKAAL